MPRSMARVPLTHRALNRATLARQLLLRRRRLGIVEAVHRVVALQAQAPASPYLALWNRLRPFDPAALDRAFATHAIVKATQMRSTLHAVDAADYPAFHEAMQPFLRAARLDDTRFTVAGLSVEDADALVPPLLAYASEPRSNADIEAWLDERLGVLPRPGVWWALRRYAPFVLAPTGGPWSFGQGPAFLAARDLRRPGDVAASLRHLVVRYLEGFGPATVADVAQFSMVTRGRVRETVQALGDALVALDGPDGAVLLDVPDGELPGEGTPAPPRLMAMWDSTLLAYADRARIVPTDLRRHVMRANGDVLPTILVDGYVAGVWRPVEDGIEVTALHPIAEDAWAGLDAEARALRAFLADREPGVYGRYGHWWARLRDGERRVLGG
jgi:hypothetical protein